jgi:malonyl-CoA O-methyltransferase
MNSEHFLDKSKIARSFTRFAETYDKFASLQKQLAIQLVDAIRSLNLSPKNILDIGTGTGEVAFLLHDFFPNAKITGCDIAPGMIKKATQKNPHKCISFEICDAESLPYPDNEFDLIVSSTTYQWVEDLQKAFSEAKRVLKDKCNFLFITFGPDSLMELKKSYKLTVDEKAEYLHEYRTVSEIGKLLESCGLKVSNLNSKIVRTIYSNFREMQKTIKNIGALNASTNLPKGLRSKEKIRALIKYYETTYRLDDSIYATYEIIEAACKK